MYKRTPTGEYLVSVCTNTLCGMLGGDEIFAALSDTLGVGIQRDDRGRHDHPRARRVPGRLRLRAGRHRQLRVLRQPDRRVGGRASSASCSAGRARRCPRRGAPLCTFSRSSGRSPGSSTTQTWRRRDATGDAAVRRHRGRRRELARRPAAETRAVATPPSPIATERREGQADMPLTPVLTKRFGTIQPWKIDNYERLDGYDGAAQGADDGARRAHRAGQGIQPARARRRRASRPA